MPLSGAIQNNERVQSQIGISIGLARGVVASWLPPMTEEEKKLEEERAKTVTKVLSNRRAPRAGLGSTGEKDESAELSIGEMKIKRKLAQKEKRLKEVANDRQKNEKRRSTATNREQDSSSEDEHAHRKGQKKARVAVAMPDMYSSRKEKKVQQGAHRGFGR